MRSSAGNFAVELVGRLILVAVAMLSARFRWWTPLIVAPVFWQVWDTVFGRRARIHAPTLQLVVDVATYLVWISYMALALLSIGMNIGHWYGWAIGAIVGIGVAHVFGLLFPYRWHLERLDALWGTPPGRELLIEETYPDDD